MGIGMRMQAVEVDVKGHFCDGDRYGCICYTRESVFIYKMDGAR